MSRKQRFECILKRAARCFHVHTTTPTGHGPQWPRYAKSDRHQRLLFRPTAETRFLEETGFLAAFVFLRDARFRFSVGLGVLGPASSETTALATQTICGRPLSNSFQVLPASLDAYSLP